MPIRRRQVKRGIVVVGEVKPAVILETRELDRCSPQVRRVVLVTGLTHLESIAQNLVGEPERIRFLESSVEEVLSRGDQ